MRVAIDALFIAALVFMMRTPELLAARPVRKAGAISTLFSVAIAAFVLFGLVTMPHGSPALVLWRIATSVALVVVLASGLRSAVLRSRALRGLAAAIVALETVATLTAVAVDLPAALHAADLTIAATGAALESPAGLPAFPGAGALFGGSPLVQERDGRLHATQALETALRVTRGGPMLSMIGVAARWKPSNARAVNICNYWDAMDVPLDGYPSAAWADIVLDAGATCLERMEPAQRQAKLAEFAAALPGEATPQEQAAARTACGGDEEAGLLAQAAAVLARRDPGLLEGLARPCP